MDKKIHSWAVVACIALVATMAVAVPAGAHTQTIRDRNDVPGKLDIGRITASHSDTKVTHTISTLGRWSPRLLRRNNFFLGWFSTDDDKSDAERLLYIFFQNGRLRGVVVNRRGTPLFTVRVSRPNAKTVRWSFGQNQLTSKGGYAWGGFSFYKASGRCFNICVDAAPNRAPAWLDYSPPIVDIVSEAPNGLLSDVAASATQLDLGLIAVEKGAWNPVNYKLQRRAVGTSTWSTIWSGATTDTYSVLQATPSTLFQEGTTYDLRVIVDDGPHTSVSSLRLLTPRDDNSPSITGGFSEGWTSTDDGGLGSYHNTVHRSSVAGSTFTHSFEGSEVWVLGYGGSIDVSIDGVPVASALAQPPAQRRRVSFNTTLTPGPHDIDVSVDSGTVNIDAIATR